MLFDETKLQSPILYSEHMMTDGGEMFAASCKLGFEGIISKNSEAPYRSDRNEGWLPSEGLLRQSSFKGLKKG
jgi:bifunctional non-homologous end joining protein LigD